jgi:hypothetical protein
MATPKLGHIFRLAQIIQESCEHCTDQEAASLAKAILEHPSSRWCPRQTPEPENADHASLDIEHKLQKARDEEFMACRGWLCRNVKMGGNLSDAICIARRDERYWNDLKR